MPTLVKPYGVSEWGPLPPLLTTLDTNADVGIWNVVFLRSKRFRFTAAGNALVVTVLGSFDGGVTYDVTVEADIAAAVATPVLKVYTDAVTHVKVQVRPNVSGQHGTLTTQYFGSSY